MRVLVALIAVFMVSGHAVATKRSFTRLGTARRWSSSASSKVKGRQGYFAETPRPAKHRRWNVSLVAITTATSMRRKCLQLSGAELQQLCFEDR